MKMKGDFFITKRGFFRVTSCEGNVSLTFFFTPFKQYWQEKLGVGVGRNAEQLLTLGRPEFIHILPIQTKRNLVLHFSISA
jgi:hypothetical protein